MKLSNKIGNKILTGFKKGDYDNTVTYMFENTIYVRHLICFVERQEKDLDIDHSYFDRLFFAELGKSLQQKFYELTR